MNSKKIQLAFIGGGVSSIVGCAHYSAINIDNNFELVAGVFSTNSEINLLSADYYKVDKKRVYNDIDSLIINEKNKIDACVVITPTNLHFSHVMTLIQNGIPVICEKALSSSVKEAILIKEMLIKNNGFLAVTYNYLGYPIVKEMRHMVKFGMLGEILHVQVEMPQESFLIIDSEGKPKTPSQWRLLDGSIPNLSLDLAVHLQILLKYIIDEKPLSVVALCNNKSPYYSVVDNTNCIINYSSAISCSMWFSKIAIGKRNGMKISIYGSKASFEWIQEQPELLFFADNKGNRSIIDRGSQGVSIASLGCYNRFKTGHPLGYVEAFANYYNSIAVSISKYKAGELFYLDDCFGIEDSIEGLKLLEAIIESSKESKWIDID